MIRILFITLYIMIAEALFAQIQDGRHMICRLVLSHMAS